LRKPHQESPKPDEETGKPHEESAKPHEETPKPDEELPKLHEVFTILDAKTPFLRAVFWFKWLKNRVLAEKTAK
jgi:hypothetical protein